MRIKFLKTVPVKLETVPKTAWGMVQPHFENSRPTVNPETGQFEIAPSNNLGHCFPVGAIVELPDQLAQIFITLGEAEENVSSNGKRIAAENDGVIL